MEFIMKNLAILSTFLLYTSTAFAEDTPNLEKVPCGDPASMQEVLFQKGYFHLLDMKNQNGANEQLWSGGQDMVITVERDKKICLVSTATDVTFNPTTLEKIISVWKKTQKEL
jgi:hypothetical protein